jgi:hypothetical protein
MGVSRQLDSALPNFRLARHPKSEATSVGSLGSHLISRLSAIYPFSVSRKVPDYKAGVSTQPYQ